MTATGTNRSYRYSPEGDVLERKETRELAKRGSAELLRLLKLYHSDKEQSDAKHFLQPVEIEDIKRAVCATYKISTIECDSRRRQHARIRQIAIYLARQLTLHSFPVISKQFGGRDHTTAVYAAYKIERVRETDPRLDAELRVLETLLTESRSHG